MESGIRPPAGCSCRLDARSALLSRSRKTDLDSDCANQLPELRPPLQASRSTVVGGAPVGRRAARQNEDRAADHTPCLLPQIDAALTGKGLGGLPAVETNPSGLEPLDLAREGWKVLQKSVIVRLRDVS